METVGYQGRFTYEYNLKDHLGNTLVTFSDKDDNGYIWPFAVYPDGLAGPVAPGDYYAEVEDHEIVQENHYYPFGMGMEGTWGQVTSTPDNDYLYNGKEMQSDLGLDWLVYGARMYDPAIGRWNAVDPLASSYYTLSPYCYVGNMPSIAVDPDGMRIIITNDIKNTLTSLAKIAATKQGGRRISSLIARTQNYRTQSIWFTTNSAYDPTGEVGPKRTIYFVGTAWRTHLDYGRNKSMYVLAHELDHAYDDSGTRRSREIRAVNFANNIRAVYGETAMRKRYFGLVSNFSDDPNTYNPANESVTNFTELNDISAGGSRYLGFSYEKSENGTDSSTNYILSVRAENGEYAYRIFDNKDDYDAAIERVNNLNNDKNEE